MLDQVLADLAAESEELDQIVAALPDPDWRRPTPSPGWTIAHQIAHLAWTDDISVAAIADPERFAALLGSAGANLASVVDSGAADRLAPSAELLSRWRTGRAALATHLRNAPRQIPWVGTSMSPTSMATARIMETWAHGQDIADALGHQRPVTPRLRNVAYLGYRTFRHGFAAHGRPVPEADVRVELSTPDGAQWMFGPPEADDRVIGPALDFCLLVTQRRHPADLALRVAGPVAKEWLEVAQVFAGPPGGKRQPA